MPRRPAPPSPVMQALRSLERAERRKAKPEPTPRKNAKPPRANGGKSKSRRKR